MTGISNGLWQLILVYLICVACSYKNQKSAHLPAQTNPAAAVIMNENGKRPTATIPGNKLGPVAPGSCRLVAEIMVIKPQLEPDKTLPCGKVPCTAIVKIRKIIAYGAAFKPLLKEGQEIPVYFAFTLSPTIEYFPGLTTPLPGLKVGSIFQADLNSYPEGGTGKGDRYQVYTYAVKS